VAGHDGGSLLARSWTEAVPASGVEVPALGHLHASVVVGAQVHQPGSNPDRRDRHLSRFGDRTDAGLVCRLGPTRLVVTGIVGWLGAGIVGWLGAGIFGRLGARLVIPGLVCRGAGIVGRLVVTRLTGRRLLAIVVAGVFRAVPRRFRSGVGGPIDGDLLPLGALGRRCTAGGEQQRGQPRPEHRARDVAATRARVATRPRHRQPTSLVTRRRTTRPVTASAVAPTRT
jgi:hypothetical protein